MNETSYLPAVGVPNAEESRERRRFASLSNLDNRSIRISALRIRLQVLDDHLLNLCNFVFVRVDTDPDVNGFPSVQDHDVIFDQIRLIEIQNLFHF